MKNLARVILRTASKLSAYSFRKHLARPSRAIMRLSNTPFIFVSHEFDELAYLISRVIVPMH